MNNDNHFFFSETASNADEYTDMYANILQNQQVILNAISAGNAEAALSVLEDWVPHYEKRTTATFTGTLLGDRKMQGQMLLSLIIHQGFLLLLPVNRLFLIFSKYTHGYLDADSIKDFYKVTTNLITEVCDLVLTNNAIGTTAIVRKASRYINENITRPLTEDEVAEHAEVSVSRLNILFKNEINCTVYKYIMHRKMKLACFYLLESSMSVAEISHELSFASSSHFGKLFRQYIGKTPTEYRNSSSGFSTEAMLPEF
ncbi:MAG: AraC family transcriptional regulator [Butyrivibrio sp.]|uniref:helix-turn-helix transcriptional regulator n=1 Tax=Butyrivibrio sp. TaxID=28121 RepID=UPI0025DE025D|nr:AraC family transcriptional regulator [Butyrivibrio sp.]MCR5772198.1 AraC family transcriptional regulator [Butyrivibrio sp.]